MPRLPHATPLQPGAIHQFHTGSALGDGITNAMFFIQSILRQSGYQSDIYCVHVEPILDRRILPFSSFEDRPEDLLLVHYSLGSDRDPWITARACPMVLVYHSITPARFFLEGSRLARLAAAGREQLARWARDRTFAGAIADSAFNRDELVQLGFASVAVIGLLVDLDRMRQHAWTQDMAAELAGARNLLFVGRIAPNKNQLDLVRMIHRLSAISRHKVRLVLAGATNTDEYEAEIRQAIERLGVGEQVRMLGARSDDDICALFRMADLYVSASLHEGFGMPLVEAMAVDLPVLAYAAGSVETTLGPGGLVLRDGDPDRLAAVAALMLEEPGLRRRVIQGQRSSLARFERPVLVRAFEAYLRQCGFTVSLHEAAVPAPGPPRWCIEGPFDSSYSLAVVNRELARGLARAGESVALVSRDGPAPFVPDPGFLAAQPDLAEMARRGVAPEPAEFCLRNQYPPHVDGMRGAMRVLCNYAWEESGFPAEWVQEFNTGLDLITVTSAYVGKVLRDNGVRTPIVVAGNGASHVVLDTPPVRGGAGRFRFLHVSSGFPRKGIDALLDAWGAAFTGADAVELVIKTFPNEHNRTAAQVAAFCVAHPAAAPVQEIEADIDEASLHALLAGADAVVCPSRGEGFGLVLAEAMAHGKPVITSGHGGQTDFCTDQTAWLCGYSFAYAQTHLPVFDSVWAEPDRESLAQAMRAVHTAPASELALRTSAARQRIQSRYSWDEVAARTRAAVRRVWNAADPAGLRQPRIGLVSTWNVRCGIAAYAQSMASAIGTDRLHVFANRVTEVNALDPAYVRRCWMQDWRDKLDDLFREISESGVDAVVIQFNFGFFHPDSFARLLDRLHERGTLAIVVFHSTQDISKPEITIKLADLRASLSRARRLLVHSVHDLNRLKGIGLTHNVTLFPMGLPPCFAGDREAVRRALGWQDKTVVASFGYLLPHKGLRQLIAALPLLRETVPNVHLQMLNALYPVPASDEELEACRRDITEFGIQERVALLPDFMGEEELIRQLAAADVIVFPYQHTQESASAAVRMGLASFTPVAVSPLPIFADVADVTYALPGVTAADIADGLAALLGEGALAAARLRQRAWVAAHDWKRLSARLDGLIEGELAQREMGL